MGLADIYVHGVANTGRSQIYYEHGFRAMLRAARAKVPNAQNEISIDFNWAYEDRSTGKKHNPFTNASDSFGDEAKAGDTLASAGMSKQQWTGARKLAVTILKLREALDQQGAIEEPINVVAHSQGTLVTVAALNMLKEAGYSAQELRVGNLMLMGSPLDKEDAENPKHQSHRYVETAATMIRGSMNWHWSDEDDTAMLKGGIGKYGLGTATFQAKNVFAWEHADVHHSHKKGWWSEKWLKRTPHVLDWLISTSTSRIDPTSARLQDVQRFALEWAGSTGTDFEFRGNWVIPKPFITHGSFDIPLPQSAQSRELMKE
jgi:pimeloyl-ACP methyl ester carboxylesterase